MGLLGNIFGKGEKEIKEKKVKINWIPLTSVSQLDEIQNNTSAISALFKHSTRCGISSGVIRQFETKNEPLKEEVDFYYLDLLNYRDISTAIAEKFQVLHQSPQLVVVKNGDLVAHASHYDIISVEIDTFI